MADQCGAVNLICKGVSGAASAATDAGVSSLADATTDMYSKIASGFANAWMVVPDPQTSTSGTNTAAVNQFSGNIGTTPAATSSALDTILGYASWTALVIAALSLAALGVGLVVRRRSSTGQELFVRWIPMFTAVGMICAAGAIASAVAKPIVNGNQSTAIYFLQANTAWLMIALVAIAIIITAIVMLVRHRGEPLRDLAIGIGKMAFVSAAGTSVASVILKGMDSWSWTLMDNASNCNGDATCFGKSVEGLVGLASTSAIGQLGVIVLGIIGVILLVVQMGLFLVRSALLPLLLGLLPLAYAAALVPGGKNMSRRMTGWLVAFVFYKPAAAIIYSVAMVLSGQAYTAKDTTGLFNMLYGFILVAAAAIALPALIRLCVPAAEAVASGMAGASLLGLAGMGVAEGAGSLAAGAIRRGASSSGDGGGNQAATPPMGAANTGPAASTPGTEAASTGAASTGGGAGGAAAANGAGATAAGATSGGVALAATAAVDAGKTVAQGAAQAISSGVEGPSGAPAAEQPRSTPYQGPSGSGQDS